MNQYEMTEEKRRKGERKEQDDEEELESRSVGIGRTSFTDRRQQAI